MSERTPDERTPVSVLTGFLGSGKTTLLRSLLAQPKFQNAAVIVNEAAEIPLDHMLIGRPADQVALLSNGCLCCAARSDLSEALARLFRAAAATRILPSQVLVETSGLAAPAPIVQTFLSDRNVAARFRLSSFAATLDATFADESLIANPAAVHQLVTADQIVVTKADLATRAQIRQAGAKARALNPHAILRISGSSRPIAPRLWSGADLPASDRGWRRFFADSPNAEVPEHDIEICTFQLNDPIEWNRLSVFLGSVRDRLATSLLRCKAVVNVPTVGHPVVVHGVRHVFYPPETLDTWPDGERRSKFVFIFQGRRKAELLDCLSSCSLAVDWS
jgi:G3E family GTPase